jgi:hypothetical protein
MIDELLRVLESPYDEHLDVPAHWSSLPPKTGISKPVSCSS